MLRCLGEGRGRGNEVAASPGAPPPPGSSSAFALLSWECLAGLPRGGDRALGQPGGLLRFGRGGKGSRAEKSGSLGRSSGRAVVQPGPRPFLPRPRSEASAGFGNGPQGTHRPDGLLREAVRFSSSGIPVAEGDVRLVWLRRAASRTPQNVRITHRNKRCPSPTPEP